MATHSGLANVQSADQTITDDLIVTDALTVNGNATIGNAVTDTLGFYGVTAVDQPATASQAAVTATLLTTVAATAVTAVLTTAATTTSPHGFATGTQADAIVARVNQLVVDVGAYDGKINQAVADVGTLTTLVNQLRGDLVSIGLIKGSA